MTESATSSPSVTVPARSNVYTALVAVAFVVLAMGVIYVALRNVSLYGGALPLQPPASSSSSSR